MGIPIPATPRPAPFASLVICKKLRAKLRFSGFLSVFGTFAHKVAQTWFVLNETWHTTLFGVYYFVKMFMIEIICLKLRAKLRF